MGSGVVGQALAGGFIKHNPQVVCDKDAKDLQEWAAKTPGARLGTFPEAGSLRRARGFRCTGPVVENIIGLVVLEP